MRINGKVIMNMKKIGMIALALITATTGAYAQKGVEDGSRYGQGQDSINTLRNISIYSEYVKTGNYKDAYEQGWKQVFEEAPLASVNTYTNGVKILRWMYKNETDAEKKLQYSQELQKVYEQRLQYLDKLNAQSKNQALEYDIYGQMAHDFVAYNPKPALNAVYEKLRKAVDMGKDKTAYYVLDDLMKFSSQRYKSKPDNEEYREAILQDYLDCAEYIDVYLATQTNEQALEQAAKTKENIDGYFVKSGAADCETLQNIYGPKIEENRDNLDYLNKVVTLMSIFDCKSSDAYFTAAEYAHNISPSVKTAKSLGYLYLKQRDDIDKALEYYQQAADLDEDKQGQSETYQTMATLWLSKDNYDRARSFANKAIAANPNNGNPYITLAQLYGVKHHWTDKDPNLDACAYFAVLDKLEQAKRVDPSVAEKANSLIKEYSKHCPASEDLFMLSLKAGDKVEIGGWINETTTIR